MNYYYLLSFFCGLFLNYGSLECIGILMGVCIANTSIFSLESLLHKPLFQKEKINLIQTSFIFGVILSTIRIIPFILSVSVGIIIYYNKNYTLQKIKDIHTYILDTERHFPKLIDIYKTFVNRIIYYTNYIVDIFQENSNINEEK
jgi:fructose-specific phosphotransferase system IIC component